MDDMAHRILSQQLAGHVAEHGGASVYYSTGKHVEGPGFMVAEDGAEKTLKTTTPSPDDIQSFADTHDRSSDPHAAMGAWVDNSAGKTVLDSSRRMGTVPEMRVEGKRNKQEAAYALPKTPVGGQGTPERLNRPWGADVLLNLGSSQSKGGEPFLDLHANEAETIVDSMGGKHARPNIYWGRATSEIPTSARVGDEGARNDRVPDPRHISLNEVDNDSWSMTNRHNLRGASGLGPGRTDSRSRIQLGDTLRLINHGRTLAARGIGVTVHPEKGFHLDSNEKGEKVGPSKVKKDLPDVGERTAPKYDAALESERVVHPLTPNNEGYRNDAIKAAMDLHKRMSAAQRQQRP